ncbi:uncharacterized protein [Littorina saxatilis]|uniref:uncharacterized protein n=1 Tax=Littorina saxatilis TaxID=31220 RepID=UPI0038B618C2
MGILSSLTALITNLTEQKADFEKRKKTRARELVSRIRTDAQPQADPTLWLSRFDHCLKYRNSPWVNHPMRQVWSTEARDHAMMLFSVFNFSRVMEIRCFTLGEFHQRVATVEADQVAVMVKKHKLAKQKGPLEMFLFREDADRILQYISIVRPVICPEAGTGDDDPVFITSGQNGLSSYQVGRVSQKLQQCKLTQARKVVTTAQMEKPELVRQKVNALLSHSDSVSELHYTAPTSSRSRQEAFNMLAREHFPPPPPLAGAEAEAAARAAAEAAARAAAEAAARAAAEAAAGAAAEAAAPAARPAARPAVGVHWQRVVANAVPADDTIEFADNAPAPAPARPRQQHQQPAAPRLIEVHPQPQAAEPQATPPSPEPFEGQADASQFGK